MNALLGFAIWDLFRYIRFVRVASVRVRSVVWTKSNRHLMRKLLCLLAACSAVFFVSSQTPVETPGPNVPPGYEISIEPYIEHDGVVGGVDFTGQTTYRLYLEMQNESDFLSCISGEADNPMMIYSTSTPAWYNDEVLGEEVGADLILSKSLLLALLLVGSSEL